jgi:hypothetical protein
MKIMLKSLVLLLVVVLCSAENYYQMSVDHKLPTPDDYEKASQGSDGSEYRIESEVDRRGYARPSGGDQYESKSDNYESYSAPYGYEQSYERKKTYEAPSYPSDDGYGQSYGQGYGQSYSSGRDYVEKTYSSPIHAERRVEIKPIMTQGYDQNDHTIDIKDDTPIVIHFRTHANRIKVEQTRVPDKPKEVEHTRSEDEPHRVIHEVYKPVIQEIREIIQPFRKVVQQVQPVVEEVQTVVHRGDGRRGSSGGNGGGQGGEEYGGSGQKQSYGKGYSKRSTIGSKKYNSAKEYLPQGSVLSVRGVPVYRSIYKGPALSEEY